MNGATERTEAVPGLRVGLVVVDDEAPGDDCVAALAKDALLVTRLSADRAPAMECAAVLVWLPGNVARLALSSAVAWRDRHLAAALLLGCAPRAEPPLGEIALSVGFDDFVAGRGSAREISARLRALARRATPSARPSRHAAVVHGRLALVPEAYEVWVGHRAVTLTARERHALKILLENAGKVVPRVALIDELWGKDELDVSLRAVDNLIHRLRRKIGSDLIVSVRGVGFRLADR